MRVLVLGGYGIVGSRLVSQLICRNHNVSVIDLKDRKKNDCFNYLKIDIKKIYIAKEYFKNEKYEVIYDFCCTSPEMIRACINFFSGKVKHYILCSTVSVYDFNKLRILPIVEEEEVKNFYCCEYGAKRAECEYILENSGIKYTILRPCYIYGVGYHNDRIEYLIDSILSKQYLAMSNNLEITFQLLNVEDLIAALLKAAFLPNAQNKIFNVCPDECITLERLIALISSFEDIKVKVTTSSNAPYIPKLYNQSLIFSNIKIKELLEWKPMIDLCSGIKKLYEHRKNEKCGKEE